MCHGLFLGCRRRSEHRLWSQASQVGAPVLSWSLCGLGHVPHLSLYFLSYNTLTQEAIRKVSCLDRCTGEGPGASREAPVPELHFPASLGNSPITAPALPTAFRSASAGGPPPPWGAPASQAHPFHLREERLIMRS